MPTLRRINRERGLDRDRVRPTAPGNFVTLTKGGSIYYLLFKPTIIHYIKYEIYISPYPRAFGYRDEPPGDPPLRLLGPAADPNDLIPRDILAISDPVLIPPSNTPLDPFKPVISPTPYIPPDTLPGVSPTHNQPNNAGKMFSFIPGTAAKQILSGSLAIAEVVIKADEDNADDIWISYAQDANRNNGYRLVGGAGIVLAINDLSKIYLIAFNTTDSVQVIYNT